MLDSAAPDSAVIRTRLRQAASGIGEALVGDPFGSLCDLLVANFALWTVTWNVSYLAGGSFQTALIWAFVASLISPLILMFKDRQPVQKDFGAWQRRTEYWMLIGLMALAVVMTLIVHRPDEDDENYLGIAVALLREPDVPVMHLKALALGTEYGRWAISIFNPLSAALSYVTGIPVLYWYYLVIPAVSAALLILVYWRLLRLLVGDGWAVGLLFVLIVMGAWGDVHRTQANFGLVRLFQGKAFLVSIVVPAILFYFLKYARDGWRRYDLAMVSLVVIAGVGATPTGLAVGPLVVVTLGLAAFRARTAGRFLQVLGILLLIAAPLGYFMWQQYGHLGSRVHIGAGRFVDTTTNSEMYALTMGQGLRGAFMFGAAVLSFFVVNDGLLRRIYRNYILIFLILLAIPWTSTFFATAAYATMSWRWLWIVPFPALAGIAVGGTTAKIKARFKTNPIVTILLTDLDRTEGAQPRVIARFPFAPATVFFLVVAIWFIAVSPRRVISHENDAYVRWPGFKLNQDTLYLCQFERNAEIRGGRLYLEGSERGF